MRYVSAPPAPLTLASMPEPATGPRLRALIDTLRPGIVRRVKVTGFDGADILPRWSRPVGGSAQR
ncbi:hypothetical protein GCM10010267_62430 [Streptomyces griseorubens]|nr:hypothetical protein GCM10010267_62430 [Streptomyces griseorubens]